MYSSRESSSIIGERGGERVEVYSSPPSSSATWLLFSLLFFVGVDGESAVY